MSKIKQIKQTSNYGHSIPKKQDPIEAFSSINDPKQSSPSARSIALLKKGVLCLLHDDIAGLHLFDTAMEIDPTNTEMLLEQGLALFEYGSAEGKEQVLTFASKHLKQATTLNPTSFEAWHTWANTLHLLGRRKKNGSYFLNAKKKYEKAIALSTSQPPAVLADLYWDYADLLIQLAKQSQEALDLHLALQAYTQATTHQDHFPTEFWVSFGDACLKLGKQTNHLPLFIKGINLYKKSISTHISRHEGWLKLACGFKSLYNHTYDEEHFSQGNEFFGTTVQLHPHDVEVWCEWAELLLQAGRSLCDAQMVRASIEKCYRGFELNPHHSSLLSIWAEALALLGMLTDCLDLIHEAQDKVAMIVEEIGEEHPEVFCSSGMCLMALGTYFKDPDYYYQAIEKFQEGLSLNRASHTLWHALGKGYLSAAILDHDEESFQHSFKFFKRALNLKETSHCRFDYALSLFRFGELNQDQDQIKAAICHFHLALHQQKNTLYIHPEWFFEYGCALAHLGELTENQDNYTQALSHFNHTLTLSPDFPQIHYQIAMAYSHYGELINQCDLFHQAFHHYRIAHQRDKENDHIILDWGITLLNLAELLKSNMETNHYLRQAERKITQAARLGNTHAYYPLACLYSILGDPQRSLFFLEKALAFETLPPLDAILEEEWLEPLRKIQAFDTFLKNIEHHPKSLEN